MDKIENTNAKKKDLFLSLDLDSNCKMYLGINCLMPNGILESFNWIDDVAIVRLGFKEAIIKFKLAISDQERVLYKLLENIS